MKRGLLKGKGMLFLILLSALLFFGGTHSVSAATKKCQVTFADGKGRVSNNTYKKWGRKVNAGQWIYLPEYSRAGHKSYWELTTGKKTQRYLPGAKYQVKNNVTFRLRYYPLYDIRFYSDGGGSEHKGLKLQAIKGETITLPSVPHSTTLRGLGWANSTKDKSYKKAGTKVKVTGNMKFYSRTYRVTSVALYNYKGEFWKYIRTDGSKTPTFPAVNLGSLNMCLGWSKTLGKISNPEYLAGDKIPSKVGKYYMVKFGPSDDRAPSYLYTPEKHDKVFFVGDSRTVQLRWALGSQRSSKVDFVAEGGQGLDWFKTTGYQQLHKKMEAVYKSNHQAKQAVVINLGINDLDHYREYISYMKKVSTMLRRDFNCDMYYMSLNPINSAVISASNFIPRTEQQVNLFNRSIRANLCTGNKRSFQYLDCWTGLQKYGWLSNPYNQNKSDGLHYSKATYLRIYNFVIQSLNR